MLIFPCRTCTNTFERLICIIGWRWYNIHSNGTAYRQVLFEVENWIVAVFQFQNPGPRLLHSREEPHQLSRYQCHRHLDSLHLEREEFRMKKYLKVYRLCNVMKQNLRFVNEVNFLSSIHSSDMFNYYGKEGVNGTINVLHKKMSWKKVCSQSWHRVFVLLHSAFVEAKGWKSFQRSCNIMPSP